MHVLLEDVRVFFDVEGPQLVPRGQHLEQRSSIVCLHGGPGVDHTVFKPFLSPLADVAQVIYVDQRGHGRSDRSDPSMWNLKVWGSDVRRFCDTLGIADPVVFGHSFGAVVALSYATQYPEHPYALVLSGATGKFDRQAAASAFGRLGGPAAAEAAARFFSDPTSPTAERRWEETCVPLYLQRSFADSSAFAHVKRNDAVRRHYAAHEAFSFNFLPRLAHLRCPVLVIAGSDDPFCPPEALADLADALPPGAAKVDVLPSVGHAPYREATSLFLAMLRSFVAANQSSMSIGHPTGDSSSVESCS